MAVLSQPVTPGMWDLLMEALETSRGTWRTKRRAGRREVGTLPRMIMLVVAALKNGRTAEQRLRALHLLLDIVEEGNPMFVGCITSKPAWYDSLLDLAKVSCAPLLSSPLPPLPTSPIGTRQCRHGASGRRPRQPCRSNACRGRTCKVRTSQRPPPRRLGGPLSHGREFRTKRQRDGGKGAGLSYAQLSCSWMRRLPRPPLESRAMSHPP